MTLRETKSLLFESVLWSLFDDADVWDPSWGNLFSDELELRRRESRPGEVSGDPCVSFSISAFLFWWLWAAQNISREYSINNIKCSRYLDGQIISTLSDVSEYFSN